MKSRSSNQRVHRQPSADEYTATVRFVNPPIDHDWKALGKILESIGAPYVPASVVSDQDALACPS